MMSVGPLELRDKTNTPDSRGSSSPLSTSSSGSPVPDSYPHVPVRNIVEEIPESHKKSLDMLVKIFPQTKIYVLALILRGCGGDIVQAIESVLNSQSEAKEQAPVLSNCVSPSFLPSNYLSSPLDSSFKSAFTPTSISGLQVSYPVNPARYSLPGLPPIGLLKMPPFQPLLQALPTSVQSFSGFPAANMPPSKQVLYSSYQFSHMRQQKPSELRENQ